MKIALSSAMKEFFAALGISSIIVLVSGLLLFCCCCCFMLYAVAVAPANNSYGYTYPNTGTIAPTPTAPSTNNNTGEHVSVQLPSGWSAQEFEDGKNLVGSQPSTFTGFTGLKIYSPSGRVVVNMMAITAVDGTSFCSNVYKMTDSDPAYITQKLASDQGLYGGGSNKPKLVEVPGPYKDFTMLGKKGRVANDRVVYWADANTTKAGVFNARCDDLSNLITVDGLSFYHTSPGITSLGENYIITTDVKGLSAAELDDFLTIVNSIKVAPRG
jgi:hypothetical protein